MPLISTPGDPNSDAYFVVSEFRDYTEARGIDLTGISDLQIEQGGRRATSWLDGVYEKRFPGTRSSDLQARAWPRRNAVTSNGFPIPDDVIPQVVIYANMEATAQEIKKPGMLVRNVRSDQRIRRVKAGPVDVEYFGFQTSSAPQVILPSVDNFLSTLIRRTDIPGVRVY